MMIIIMMMIGGDDDDYYDYAYVVHDDYDATNLPSGS